jgi:hypothetical protein
MHASGIVRLHSHYTKYNKGEENTTLAPYSAYIVAAIPN